MSVATRKQHSPGAQLLVRAAAVGTPGRQTFSNRNGGHVPAGHPSLEARAHRLRFLASYHPVRLYDRTGATARRRRQTVLVRCEDTDRDSGSYRTGPRLPTPLGARIDSAITYSSNLEPRPALTEPTAAACAPKPHILGSVRPHAHSGASEAVEAGPCRRGEL